MHCKLCGKEFDIFSAQIVTVCNDCCAKYKSGHIFSSVYCLLCGVKISDFSMPPRPFDLNKLGGNSLCPKCSPPNGKNAHNNAVLRWQKRNPEKVKASQKARYRKDLANVIYECRCDCEKKHFHHFDYSRPFDVILLCPACHAAEHKRLRNLEQSCVSKCS